MNAIIRKHELEPWIAEKIADRLFQDLQNQPHIPQAKRVEHIIEWLSRLGENKRDFYAFTQLRESLKRYEWRYGLTLSASELSVDLFISKEMAKEDEWECNAVRFLLKLVPQHLDRLRRCAYDGCKSWFFAARRADQKFCKRGACRQNYYESAPSIREKKKRKMRELRATEKKRDEMSKTRIGFKGRIKKSR